jgi:hypothetical protein
MDFFLSALVENDSGKRPTGGFGRLLSSEAVGEAGHFAEILLPGAADGKDAFSEFRAQRGIPPVANNLQPPIHANEDDTQGDWMYG